MFIASQVSRSRVGRKASIFSLVFTMFALLSFVMASAALYKIFADVPDVNAIPTRIMHFDDYHEKIEQFYASRFVLLRDVNLAGLYRTWIPECVRESKPLINTACQPLLLQTYVSYLRDGVGQEGETLDVPYGNLVYTYDELFDVTVDLESGSLRAVSFEPIEFSMSLAKDYSSPVYDWRVKPEYEETDLYFVSVTSQLDITLDMNQSHLDVFSLAKDYQDVVQISSRSLASERIAHADIWVEYLDENYAMLVAMVQAGLINAGREPESIVLSYDMITLEYEYAIVEFTY